MSSSKFIIFNNAYVNLPLINLEGSVIIGLGKFNEKQSYVEFKPPNGKGSIITLATLRYE